MMNSADKTKITEQQLKDLVLQQLGFAAFLTVHRNVPGLGYTVGILTAPTEAVNAQQSVDRIVDELRPVYELKG